MHFQVIKCIFNVFFRRCSKSSASPLCLKKRSLLIIFFFLGITIIHGIKISSFFSYYPIYSWHWIINLKMKRNEINFLHQISKNCFLQFYFPQNNYYSVVKICWKKKNIFSISYQTCSMASNINILTGTSFTEYSTEFWDPYCIN